MVLERLPEESVEDFTWRTIMAKYERPKEEESRMAIDETIATGGVRGITDPDRFEIKVFKRSRLQGTAYLPTLAKVKSHVNFLKKLYGAPFIEDHDILIEDTKEGTEYHVDQNWKLVEM